MATPLALTVFNPPYGIDQTSTRMWLRGKALFSSGSYIAGGLLPTSGWNPLAQDNGENVLISTYTQPAILAPTTSSLTTNVATLIVGNALVVGQYVTFNSLSNLPFLNGLTLIVTSRSATQFTVAFTHANVASAAETGNAVLVIGPDDMILTSQTGSGYIYQYNKSFATIQIFESAASTPSGTIGAQTLAIAAGTPATFPIGTAANTGTTTLVATAAVTVTGISTATFTGTAGTAVALSELAVGALPAGVLADIINWSATYAKQ